MGSDFILFLIYFDAQLSPVLVSSGYYNKIP